MWFTSHVKKGKELNIRAFREYDNPLWKATKSGGNSKASLSQVAFFHSQMVYSFPWPIPLVPSLLWFLSVLILCWLSAAFLELDSGFLFSWLIPATRTVALRRGCQHLFGEPILPPPMRPSFVGLHLGPDLTWYSVSCLTDQCIQLTPGKKLVFLLANIFGVNCWKNISLGDQKLFKEVCFLTGQTY